jgi:uncharacterized membrane protein YsdA (DUF1294 family)
MEKIKYKYLATINFLTIILYKVDKNLSLSHTFKFRIPEKYLLGCSLLGGTPASIFSIHFFKHKNKKMSFLISTYTIMLGQIYLIHRMNEIVNKYSMCGRQYNYKK